MGATFIPGQFQHGGFDVNGDGKIDVTMPELMAHSLKRPRGQEVRMLNQYTGYFSTDEGDYPVTVVANSIKEAAKILTMPGVFGQDSEEPTTIKFVKHSVGVSVPVHNVGFTTTVVPSGAVDSGAYATPANATVTNGTEVIFTAYEPFGWKFDGWYKGDPEKNGVLLSTELQSTIDVYDAYSTLVSFYAKYTFDPKIRNGRYMDVQRGWIFDLDFDGWASYPGRFVVSASQLADYYFAISELKVNEDGSGTMTLIPDPSLIQPEEITMKLSFTPSYVGLNLAVDTVTMDNFMGLMPASCINLKYVGPEEN